MARKLEHEARQMVGKNWGKGSGTHKKLLSNIRSIARYMETQSLQSIKHMKTKHVLNYFEYQKQRGLSASTLQNHATAMRFLAQPIGKRNIVPRTNQELGIVRIHRDVKRVTKVVLCQHNILLAILILARGYGCSDLSKRLWLLAAKVLNYLQLKILITPIT